VELKEVIAAATADCLDGIDKMYRRHGKTFDRKAFLADALMMAPADVPEDLRTLSLGQLSQAARNVEKHYRTCIAHDQSPRKKKPTGKEAAAGMGK